ncbi:MAG: ABATE domain-containing protein [Thermoanaerobaculia bacterium]
MGQPPVPATDPSQEYVFDLSGGALCLDFANTVGDRPWGKQEHLASYTDLLSWSRQTAQLDEQHAERLARQAARQERKAQAVFQHSLALREGIYRIFSALAAGRSPEAADLKALNVALAEALPFLKVVAEGEGFGWRWSGSEGALDRMLWPVLRSAADLLTSPEATLVRECGGQYCSWLFVDRSRTHRRRWCDMKVCGNRAKARRHYARRKSERVRNPGQWDIA